MSSQYNYPKMTVHKFWLWMGNHYAEYVLHVKITHSQAF